MRQATVLPHDYRVWLENLKTTIRSSQIKAALTVNSELIKLYWDLGKRIDEKVQHAQWGEGIIKHIAADLKTEFPNLTGFSRDNLYFMLRFYRFYQNETAIVEQLVQQIPWGHNILIFRKIKSLEVAVFYLQTQKKRLEVPRTCGPPIAKAGSEQVHRHPSSGIFFYWKTGRT